MKCLLIGNLGYIGSALEPYLKIQGHEVDGLDIKWFDNNKADQPPQDYQKYVWIAARDYDAVILLAGFSSVAMCTDLYQTLEANVFNATKLMQALRHTKVKFIYISSASVYGANHSVFPSNEYDQLPDPINHYDMSKQMLDQVAKATNLDYYGLRLATVNGWSPNIRLDLMANAMAFSAVTEGKVKLANPAVPRSVLDIQDLCHAIQAILAGPKAPGVYNLSSFSSRVIDIASEVAAYFDVGIEEQPTCPTYMFKLNTKKFEETFNFQFGGSLQSICNSLWVHNFSLKQIGEQGLQDNYKRLAR